MLDRIQDVLVAPVCFFIVLGRSEPPNHARARHKSLSLQISYPNQRYWVCGSLMRVEGMPCQR